MAKKKTSKTATKVQSFRSLIEARNVRKTNYHFEPPATDFRIELEERRLIMKFPRDVKRMLKEFDGAWTYSDDPRYAEIQFLDLYHMTHSVRDYLAECPRLGNPVPPSEQWSDILFVYQCNGFSDLFGVCLKKVGKFKKGQVVYLGESGEFQLCRSSFMELVKKGPWEDGVVATA